MMTSSRNGVLRLAKKDLPEVKHTAGVLEFVRYYLDHGKQKP